jgi:hypothetical protein
VKIFILDQIKSFQNMNDDGLGRTVIFCKRLYDRWFLREKAVLEIELRSDVMIAKIILAGVLQNQQV